VTSRHGHSAWAGSSRTYRTGARRDRIGSTFRTGATWIWSSDAEASAGHRAPARLEPRGRHDVLFGDAQQRPEPDVLVDRRPLDVGSEAPKTPSVALLGRRIRQSLGPGRGGRNLAAVREDEGQLLVVHADVPDECGFHLGSPSHASSQRRTRSPPRSRSRRQGRMVLHHDEWSITIANGKAP
jgi:hypothetical protein